MPASKPAELRRRALDLIDAGDAVSEVARTVGVSPSTIRRWMAADRAHGRAPARPAGGSTGPATDPPPALDASAGSAGVETTDGPGGGSTTRASGAAIRVRPPSGRLPRSAGRAVLSRLFGTGLSLRRDTGGARRGPWSRRVVGLPVLVLLSIVCVAVLAAAVLISRGEQSAAEAQASGYVPPTMTLPTPTPTGVAGGPVVSVVGDDVSAGETGFWTKTAAGRLGLRVLRLADTGGGYLHGSGASGSGSFSVRASQVDPTSRVVVFFGGANDAGSAGLSLLKSATRAYSVAASTAPRARIVVVGPVWADPAPPASVLAIRDNLRSAAAVARATWVDPMSAGWLIAAPGLVLPDHVTPSESGERSIATDMQTVLKNALR